MKVFGVIYLIWNKINGKRYVGQTIQSLAKRMTQHKCGYLCVDRAIQKYRFENFIYGIIETCETQEQLNEREKFWIVALHCKSPNGYNCTDGGNRDFSVSAETHAKLSLAKSGERNPNYGKKLSHEHRQKISVSHKGKKNPNYGKTCSDETKAKISATHKGEIFSEERCKNISVARRGKILFRNLSDTINEQNLSYRKLAKILNLSHSSISMKMTGKRKFTDKDIAKLVEFFGKPAEYLMKGV